MSETIHEFAGGPWAMKQVEVDPRYIIQHENGAQELLMNRMQKIRLGQQVVAAVEVHRYYRLHGAATWHWDGMRKFTRHKNDWPRREGPLYEGDPWWCPEADSERRADLRRWKRQALVALPALCLITAAAWPLLPAWGGVLVAMGCSGVGFMLSDRAWRYRCPPEELN